MAIRAGKRLLTQEDWISAGYDALAAGGVAAVSVDALARSLGVTRGSFYWHFAGRRELLDAVFARWERENTTAMFPEVVAKEDPVERLRLVFREVYDQPVDRVELVLAAEAEHPLVAPAVARVTQARLSFLRGIFTDLGLPDDVAEQRAWLAYGFYLGHHQLAGTGARPAGLDRIVELLVSS